MKTFSDLFVEIAHRLRNETPSFWKQIRAFWVYVTAISGLIVGLDAGQVQILAAVMPAAWASHVVEILKYSAAIGLISALQTKLAVKDPLKPKDPEISQQ